MNAEGERAALTVDEVAEIIGTGRTATYDAIRRGEIPSFRVGRFVRVPAWWVAQLRNGPATAEGEAA